MNAPTLNWQRPWWQLLFIVLLLLEVSFCHGYRVGDIMDAEIVLPKSATATAADGVTIDLARQRHEMSGMNHDLALKRHQMPMFGMNSHATLPFKDTGINQFAMTLEDGFRTIPLVPLVTKGGTSYLASLTLEFVYSRNSGEIHTLRHSLQYQPKGTLDSALDANGNPETIALYYNWIEEEAVDLNSGAFVMFLAVFIVSVYILFDLCGLCTDGPDMDDSGYRYRGGASDSSFTVDPMAVLSGGSAKYE